MNIFMRALLAIALLLLASAGAGAQMDNDRPPPPREDGGGPPGPARRFNLTEEQRAKAAPILAEDRAKHEAQRQSDMTRLRAALGDKRLAALQKMVAQTRPDRDAFESNAQRIDATLSPSERAAVARIARSSKAAHLAIERETASRLRTMFANGVPGTAGQGPAGEPDSGRFLTHLFMPHPGPPPEPPR